MRHFETLFGHSGSSLTGGLAHKIGNSDPIKVSLYPNIHNPLQTREEKRREEKSKRISIVIIIPYSLFLIPRAFRLSSIIISVEKSKLGERGHNKCCSVTTYEGEDINIY